ncbi:MAG: hypothetical protein Q7U76_12795 [Nitrospirota bacterium]|nr:hypothetical protein [Nitrospirota bacterium]
MRLAALHSIKRIIRTALADRSPFHFLSLSMRTQSVMQRYGVITFEGLVSRSRVELLSMRGCSKIMVREIEEELSNWGFALAPSPPCKHAQKKAF